MTTMQRARRIFVDVSRRSSLYGDAWDSPEKIIQAAVDTLQDPERHLMPVGGIDTPPPVRFLAKERWQRVFVVFDVFHDTYDPETAHLPGRNNLPVIAITFSWKEGADATHARTAGVGLRDKVNNQIRDLHDFNGIGSQPPFVVDHADGNVPTYLNPRSLIRTGGRASPRTTDGD